jgi:hypothetical protein
MDPDTICVPSGENVTQKTDLEWLSIVCTQGLQVSSIKLLKLPKDNISLCLYRFHRVVCLGVKYKAE